ncbi:MAG: sulfotransferase domain-containing protein [Candidatus Binatia bacterium]|nr:sulfotransferase domain-containing protein [Candidatus Binatia bacterium]
MKQLTEQQRARLRYVQVPARLPSLERFPDFLIIGPQRTGTTWLHAHLRFHPQVLLSEPKELFFFSRLKHPEDPRFRSSSLAWYLERFRDPWPWYVYKSWFCLWHYRERYRPLVRGEATASYAALEEDIIAEIVCLNPEIKVITMVRDPVERAWSHAKKDLVRNRGRSLGEVSDEEFVAFFNEPYQRRCAQYVQNVERWARYLRRGNLFVGLFEDIAWRPEELLLDVMAFLGVRASKQYIRADVRAPVNPSGGSEVPPRFRKILEALLAEEIAALRDRFGWSWPMRPESGAKSFVFPQDPKREPPAASHSHVGAV